MPVAEPATPYTLAANGEHRAASVTLRDILRALWRRRWLLGAAAVVAVVVAAATVLSQGPRYRATAKALLVQPQTAAPGDSGIATQQKLVLTAVTYARVVSASGFVNTSLRDQNVARGDA